MINRRATLTAIWVLTDGAYRSAERPALLMDVSRTTNS